MAWHNNFDPKIWIPLILFAFACYALMMAGIIYLICRRCSKTPRELRNQKSMEIQSIFALIAFFIGSVYNCMYMIWIKLPYHIHETLHIPEVDRTFALNFWSIFNVFFSLGYLLTYWLFWKRLIRSLDGTSMATSIIATYIYYTMLCLYLLAQLINSAIWTLVTVEKLTWDEFNFYYWTILWIRLGLDFTINVFILYQYISKMYNYTVDRNVQKARSFERNTPKDAPKLNHANTVNVLRGHGLN